MQICTLLVLLLVIKSVFCLFDPFTIGVGIGLAALGYNFDTIKKKTYCEVRECCIDEHMPANIYDLENTLRKNVFGQHIVIQQLIPALRGHWSNKEPKKPLVISFHGTPGTGKNYVSDFIVKSFYKYGLESQYVHKFVGRSDFPLKSESEQYSNLVNSRIRTAVSDCPRSVFIFDEVEKMPPGVFEALKSLLEYHSYINGVSFRKATFIFLSNTAGLELSNRLADLMAKGIPREHTQLRDFEKILEIASYNLEGGLQRASIIESHLIDHFIPFLPLEKKHIVECIKAEYKKFSWSRPTDENIKDIVDNYVTFENTYGLFATTGCKRLNKKVEVQVHYNRH